MKITTKLLHYSLILCLFLSCVSPIKVPPAPLKASQINYLNETCVESSIHTDENGIFQGKVLKVLTCPKEEVLTCFDETNMSIVEAYIRYLTKR